MSDFAALQEIELLIEKSDHGAARDALQDLREVISEDPWWYYRVGNLYHRLEMPEMAQQYWAEYHALTQRPHFPIVPYEGFPQKYHPRILTKIARMSIITILLTYICIILLFPRNDEILKSLSVATETSDKPRSLWDEWWDTNRPKKFKQHYMDSEDVWPYFFRKLSHWATGKGGSRAVSSEHSSEDIEIEYRYRIFDEATLAYFLAAKGYAQLRNYDKAIKNFEKALELAKTPVQQGTIHQEIASTYYYQGYKLQPNGLAKYELGAIRKSTESYKKAAEYLEDPYLYGNLGWAYYLLGDFGDAIHYSLKALELDDSARLNYVRMNIGLTFIKSKNYYQSFQYYYNAILLSPNENDHEGGIRDLKEIVEEDPYEHAFAKFMIGYIYYEQGHFQEAQEMLENFISSGFSEHAWIQKAYHIIDDMQQ